MPPEIVEIIIWPVVIGVCGIAALAIFRSPITNLINRMRRAGFGDKAIDFSPAPAEQQKTLEAPASTATAITVPAATILPPPIEIYKGIEAEVNAALEAAKYPSDLQKAWLIRAIAVHRVMRAHEIAYRLILGSQLELLLAANAAPVAMTHTHQIFDTAKATFPEIYANFSFEAWLHFLLNTGFVRTEQQLGQQIIRITLLGQDFLHYLINNNLTSPKVG